MGNNTNYLKIKINRLANIEYGQKVEIKGLIRAIKWLKTRSGDDMAFFKFEDVSGICEVILFPDVYSKCSEILGNNNMVVVRGNAQGEEKDPKIIAENVYEGF